MAKKAAASKRASLAAGSSPGSPPAADEQAGPSCSQPPTDRPVRVYADGERCSLEPQPCRRADRAAGEPMTASWPWCVAITPLHVGQAL